MSTPTYQQPQVIYSFTFSASPAFGHEFDNVTDMQNYVTEIADKTLSDQTIQVLIGTDWEQVWGPVVYAKVTTGATVVADNTMGCYFSPSQKLLVIAIAGTNDFSEFDWTSEDLDVHTLVLWKNVSPGSTGSGNISTATSTGLQTLLAMQDGGGRTLLQALKTYIAGGKTTGATVVVTGHSLAGALSPCLALYMVENRSEWDSATPHPAAAYPTAGPTPGDTDFAAYYEKMIADGKISYTSVYNTLDVVPLAWAPKDLGTIPFIYDAHITPATSDSPKDAFMGIAASGLVLNAMAGSWLGIPYNPYRHISTGRQSLTGTFDSNADASVSKLKYVSSVLPSSLSKYGTYVYNLARFVAQAVSQHTEHYQGLLSIGEFYTEYKIILTNNPPPNAVKIDPVSRAVRKVTGIDLGRIDPEAMARAAAAADKKTE
jgi:hypothetical protein